MFEENVECLVVLMHGRLTSIEDDNHQQQQKPVQIAAQNSIKIIVSPEVVR